MDAIRLIERDHHEVEDLFQQFEQSPTGQPGHRQDLAHTIIRELSIHASIEEQILYPAMRRALPDGNRLVQEALDEHQKAKKALAEIDDTDPEDPEFEPRVRALIQDVRHHVDEEESELLPQLRASLPSEELEEMGQRLALAKPTAPTRPHPHAPATPPANLVAETAAAAVDRARDAATGRSEKKPAPRKKPPTTKAGARRKKPSGAPKATRGKRAGATSRPRTRAAPARPRRTTAGPVIQVLLGKDGDWRAERRGSTRALARGPRKREVVQKARARARSQEGKLVIRDSAGKVQEEHTYGR